VVTDRKHSRPGWNPLAGSLHSTLERHVNHGFVDFEFQDAQSRENPCVGGSILPLATKISRAQRANMRFSPLSGQLAT
jgi:hypothetical protein